MAKAGLRVRLFGGLSVSAGGDLVDLGGARPRAIFARLAWESGRVVTVDQLVDDVWDHHPPPRVRAAIQVHVSHLRASLDTVEHRHAIETRGAGYVLQLPPTSVDVLAFAELAEAAQQGGRWTTAGVDDARQALLVWGGRPFAGLEAAPFVAPAVAWLEARRTDLVTTAGVEVRSPDHARRLLPIVERFAIGRPLDEALWSAWARLLATAGQRRDALNRIAELRRSLREGAGLDPGADVDAVERWILADETAVRSSLDRRTSTTTDRRRAATWDAVARALGDHPTVTVCGPIGVGIAGVACELERHGWDVRTVDASDRDTAALPESELLDDDRARATASARVALVLLADEAPIATARALARNLRARWSGPLVVATTAPAGLPDERIVRLDPLPLVDAVTTLHELVEAGRGRPPDASEHTLLESIAEAADGLDVALEVAAARLGRRRADRVLAEMTTAADYLAVAVTGALDELSPVAHHVVGTLASLEDWFDAIDAHRVLPRPRPGLSEVEAAVEQLVDVGLVLFDPARPEPYRVPRPIAIAVRTRARHGDAGAIAALARALAARSVMAAALIATVREAEGVEWVERRHVALERLASHPDASLVHRRAIMRSLCHTSLAAGRIAVARELLASTRDSRVLGRRDLVTVATIASASDEYRVVDECVGLAGPLRAGDQHGLELALQHVRTLRHRCEFAAAHERLDVMSELTAPSTTAMAGVDVERGMVLAMEARTDEARAALARARETFGRLGIERGLGACWVYEAWCDLADGHVRRAEFALERSRAVAAALAHRSDVAFTEVLLARVRLADADIETAGALATAALDHLRSANDRLGMARALEVLADADTSLHDGWQAEADWLRAQIGAPRSPLERAITRATRRG